MEYRKRCKVCGKIWCFTDEDIKKDTVNNVTSLLNGIGGVASALGGNIFQRQYFADRMENDERKRVNRNQCPNCNSLDCEEISAEELEDYKVKESFSKVQVSINGNATTDTLLTRVKLLLEDKDWASANAYCDSVLDTEPENGTAYLYKLMAELKVSQQEELKDKSEPFDNKATYQKVMRYADEAVRQALSGYIEHIKTRNENERLQGIYNSALNQMNSAATETAFKEAAATFGTITVYKDAEAMQRKCLEKAEQTRIETEHIAAAAKAKRTKTTIIVAVALIIAAVAGFFSYSSSQKAAAYEDAILLAEDGKYGAAIRAFSKLGNYKDSVIRTENLQETAYNEIFASIDVGAYNKAYELCKDLDNYKDCSELAVQLSAEYDRLNAVCNAKEITEDVLKEAKAVIEENEYVKSEELSASLYFFEQLQHVEWECISGDDRALSAADRDNNTWPTITTEIYERGGWDEYETLTFRYNEQKRSVGITSSSTCKYDKTTHACEWVETGTVGADYTVNLTEQGILHIVVERDDGVIFECEYKQIGK